MPWPRNFPSSRDVSIDIMPIRRFVAPAALLLACSSASSDAPSPTSTPTPTQVTERSIPESVAYFAGGCFWGVEYYMEQLDGVLSVKSGYMGGHLGSPTYEDVASQTSGHFETVEVRFDPKRVSFEAVAKRFFEIHDPTQADGQGPDIGPEYRSAVFYASPEQKQTIAVLIGRLETRGYQVATEVRPATRFWTAEERHQDYYERAGKRPYCHARVKRFGDE
jgi:peptide methionine sulfoxide reductase msrA/msrB